MKNAATKFLLYPTQHLRRTADLSTAANDYAAKLHLCFQRGPSGYSLAAGIHAHMIASGFVPRARILNRLIYFYRKSFNLDYAKRLFDEIPEPDVVARTTLIAAYSASRTPKLAREIFDNTPIRIHDTVCYNAMITCYSHNKNGHAAIQLFNELRQKIFKPDNFTYTSVLGALALIADREQHCQQLHCVVVKSGTGLVTSVVNALISVYVKCAFSPFTLSSSLMASARKLFDEMPAKDEFSWTTIIMGYVKNGYLDTAKEVFDGMDEKLAVAWNAMITGYVQKGLVFEVFELFRNMHSLAIKHDDFTYTSVLSACANAGLFLHGKQVHAYILRTESEPAHDFLVSVNNDLTTLYWKSGNIDLARSLFSARIHAHMIASGFVPRARILNRLIDFYCKSFNLDYAKRLFDEILEPGVVARTNLIAAYSASRNPKLAREIFDNTPLRIRNTIYYNAMITCYSHNKNGHAAIQLFNELRQKNFKPDDFTYTSVLGALALIADREQHCQQLHCVVVKSGTDLVTSVVNALISVYVKCAFSPFTLSSSLMASARKLFDEMPAKDGLSWTTIITGYVKNGDLDTAREVFDGMDEKLVVAWNAMISGYVHKGLVFEVFEMFRNMHSLGIKHDDFTYTSVLSACTDAGLFLHGKQVHAYITSTEAKPAHDFLVSVNNALITLYWRSGNIDLARSIFDSICIKDLVSWNAILSAYVSMGKIYEAKSIFNQIPERSMLSWTVMISGLAQHDLGEEALRHFNEMKSYGLEPCDYAFSGAITSCAVLASLEQGRQLHGQLIQLGFDSSLSAGNALITMYARCGVLDAAQNVFLTMPCLDSVSWNAMIAAFGQHGHGAQALELFEEMLEERILPDRITFLTVLSACSHAGLVEQGQQYFESMSKIYGITPGEDHYARLIDLLCRAGKLTEAKNVIQNMPFEPGAPIWEALLSGCRLHGDIELGVHAAEQLFEMIPQHDGTYILLANMFSTAGRWDDVATVRKLMRDRGVKKEPGCSWLEVENKVQVFLVDDIVHPEVQAVYSYLKELVLRIRKLGYVPDTKYVLHDMESEQKEYALSTHSEKLAVVYGLLKLPRGAPIRIFKNLRICGDCHNAVKFMSKAEGREIIVRDGKRFHHFKDGECSCGNYW